MRMGRKQVRHLGRALSLHPKRERSWSATPARNCVSDEDAVILLKRNIQHSVNEGFCTWILNKAVMLL